MNYLDVELFNNAGFTAARILIDEKDFLMEFNPQKQYTYLPASILFDSFTKTPDYMKFYSNIPDEDGKTIIFECTCLQINCGCIYMDMIEEEAKVTWKYFENNFGLKYDLGPFEFSKQNYKDCLAKLLVVS